MSLLRHIKVIRLLDRQFQRVLPLCVYQSVSLRECPQTLACSTARIRSLKDKFYSACRKVVAGSAFIFISWTLFNSGIIGNILHFLNPRRGFNMFCNIGRIKYIFSGVWINKNTVYLPDTSVNYSMCKSVYVCKRQSWDARVQLRALHTFRLPSVDL